MSYLLTGGACFVAGIVVARLYWGKAIAEGKKLISQAEQTLKRYT